MIMTLVIAIQKPIIMLDLWVRVITLNNNKYQEQRQASEKKINEELLHVAWYPERMWDWCIPNDEKKENVNMFF